jgi:hypothetical protein
MEIKVGAWMRFSPRLFQLCFVAERRYSPSAPTRARDPAGPTVQEFIRQWFCLCRFMIVGPLSWAVGGRTRCGVQAAQPAVNDFLA